jgi:glycogen debranching enzyme
MVPFPTVSRDDHSFKELGKYWRGSMWLPTAYMAIKAIEKYDYQSLAAHLAEQVVFHQLKTYQQYTPHTIWEAYAPTVYQPATDKSEKKIVRPDFCGWSALGPIALLIENILGFYEINAPQTQIKWRIHQKCCHGIRNLRFGDIITDIVYENECVKVKSNLPYNLEINEINYNIPIGSSSISINKQNQEHS